MTVATILKGDTVARKKGAGEPRPDTTLIRVSVKFAESIRDTSRFERLSVAEFADLVLGPVVEKRYRDAVLREARRMEGGKG